jgi:2-oxoglutarate dehydrogenase E2 component (dihydrolipoamide succinyltransferase)
LAITNVILPKLGESIVEATVLKILKQVGDAVKVDDTLMEIATKWIVRFLQLPKEL